MNRQLAYLSLIIATLFWGMSFPFARISLQSVDASSLHYFRFWVASLFSILIVISQKKLRHLLCFNDFLLSLVPGVVIGAVLLFQTWGLETVSAAKSGFITSLYILFTPLFERFLYQKKLTTRFALYLFLSFFGITLMVWNHDLMVFDWSKGDSATLVCALLSSVHLILQSEIAPKIRSGFLFNTYQCIWVAVISIVMAILMPTPTLIAFDWQQWPWAGIAMMGIGSSIIAFSLLIKAQTVLPAALVGLVALLEAPIAALSAYWILGEQLTALQICGGFIILSICYLSYRFPAQN